MNGGGTGGAGGGCQGGGEGGGGGGLGGGGLNGGWEGLGGGGTKGGRGGLGGEGGGSSGESSKNCESIGATDPCKRSLMGASAAPPQMSRTMKRLEPSRSSNSDRATE